MVPLVFTVAGTAFAGVGVPLATAALRLTAAGLYYTATGGAAIGTGYLAVEGGRLVVRRARPGVVGTIRAANRVARGIGDGVGDAAHAAQSSVTAAIAGGVAVGEQALSLSRDAALQLAAALPEVRGKIEAALERNPLARMISLPVHFREHPSDDALDDDYEHVVLTSTDEDGGLELTGMATIGSGGTRSLTTAAGGRDTSADTSPQMLSTDGLSGTPPTDDTNTPTSESPGEPDSGDIADMGIVLVEFNAVAEMEDADGEWVSDAMSFRTANTNLS